VDFSGKISGNYKMDEKNEENHKKDYKNGTLITKVGPCETNAAASGSAA
jgi:hypothetical protein